MSNLLFMDESNGNGVYATKSNNLTNTASTASVTNTNNGVSTVTASTTVTTKPNNFDNIMTTNAAAAAVAAATLSTSVSSEDLSLSEYTDADESISAPTEFLAEFLSAVMLKDYKKALKYCKLILQYEPNNATAKEFYPLILDKLRCTTSSDSDENYNKSSSPDLALELQSAYLSAGDSDEGASDDQQQEQQVQKNIQHSLNNADDSDDYNAQDEIYSGEAQTSNSSSGFSGGVGNESLSSVSMEEDDDDIDVDGDDDDDDDDDNDVEEDDEDAMSSSGDDLPIDEGHLGYDAVADIGLDNGSHSSHNSSSGGEGGRSRSDNTTHSYSSLLLEEDDDILPTNMPLMRDKETHDLDISNGNKVPSTSCSDSESPTEPLTQRLAAILLSKCGVSSSDENF